MNDLWAKFEISIDRLYFWQIGALQLWLRATEEEWQIACTHGDEERCEFNEDSDPPPDDVEWQRWSRQNEANAVHFKPTMPDRPLVVRPESVIKIAPAHGALYFISIPVVVSISAGRDGELKLADIPSVILSKTWFGDTLTGEPCYALKTRARPSIHDMQNSMHRAVFPVQIRNLSPKELAFHRICIRVAHLSIFGGIDNLWSNSASVNYLGEDKFSRLEYEDTPPEYKGVGVRLADAREPQKQNIIQRTFSGFKALRNL